MGEWSDRLENKDLVGKEVESYKWSEDEIILYLKGGEVIRGEAFGDCCSTTWIESIDTPDNLVGVIQSVEHIDLPVKEYKKDDYDVLAFYGLKIVTNKGHVVIDYRNESNGYYGGSIEWYKGAA